MNLLPSCTFDRDELEPFDVPDRACTLLSALEWQVVQLARNEADQRRWDAGDVGAAGLAGLAGRIWQRLTGVMPVRPLADPRLETLRRFVAMTRLGDARAGATGARLAELGIGWEAMTTISLLVAP